MSFINDLAATLKASTYDLCQPEGRMVGSKGHDRAREYLIGQLQEIGCVPYRGDSFELPYRAGGTAFTNLAAIVPGRDRTLPPMLAGAHYDSVIDAPCADDNGAAVSICLALARLATQAGGFGRDLLVVFFDAEEPPYFQTSCMGSNRFVEDQLDERGAGFAMIYDLVGHDLTIPSDYLPGDLGVPFLKSLVFMTGAESHPALPQVVDAATLPSGLKLVATLNRYVGDMSDHGAFRKKDVPYLFFSCGRWQHYHRTTDTPDRLNYRKMARLTLLSMNLLTQVDAAEFAPRARRTDPVEFEIATFRKSLGMLYPWLLRWTELPALSSRDDLDRVADKLLGLGL